MDEELARVQGREWLRIGETTIAVRARPDDRNGTKLNDLLNLHVTRERVRHLRLWCVHAVAFASVLAFASGALQTLLPGLRQIVLLGWGFFVVWTLIVVALECYWGWRWVRLCTCYNAVADQE